PSRSAHQFDRFVRGSGSGVRIGTRAGGSPLGGTAVGGYDRPMVASAAPEGDARGDAAGPGRPGGPGRLLLALMIAGGVLLVTTLGLGVTVLGLSGARADAA